MSMYDVLCIGNAIVDILAFCDDKFLIDHGIVKGSMNLVDSDRAKYLCEKIEKMPLRMSGGSAGNTAAGITALGGKAAFFGKVSCDPMGELYRQDIRSCGVEFDTLSLSSSLETGCSIVFITPDGERSMNTYLGAATQLGAEDLEVSKVCNSKITYFEGYLWDAISARQLVYDAARCAHEAGRRVAMTLSDAFCVDTYRAEFLQSIQSGSVDIVFANSHEIKSLYQTSSLDSALEAIRKDCPLSIVTRSEEGSIIINRDDIIFIKASDVPEVIDTTGAGDLYAAGFLFGYTQGYDLKTCGDLGSFAAGLVIAQTGSRLSENSRNLLKKIVS